MKSSSGPGPGGRPPPPGSVAPWPARTMEATPRMRKTNDTYLVTIRGRRFRERYLRDPDGNKLNVFFYG